MVLFDSHSRNKNGLDNPNGRAVLGSFSTVCSLNSYLKSFSEISSNISIENQYDLQYIRIEITGEIKNKIVGKLGRRHKALYNESSNLKQRESETRIKTSKKRANDNQIYYQQKKKKTILHHYITCYKDISIIVI